MKIWLSILCSFYLTFGFAQQSTLTSEDARFRAQVQQDTATLQLLLADDMLYIHSNGLVESKSDFLNSIKTGKIIYQSMQRDGNTQVRNYGKTSISNGIVAAKGINNGVPFDIRLRYTAVYHRKKSIWQLVSWQSTRI
jgi:hypothetical protein